MNGAAFDRVITIVAAVSSPVLGLLVDQEVINALTATDIGSIIATAVASYHGGKAVQRRANVPKHAARPAGPVSETLPPPSVP